MDQIRSVVKKELYVFYNIIYEIVKVHYEKEINKKI